MKSRGDRVNLTVTEKLNFKVIPSWLFDCAQVLQDHHHQAFLVGGAVRDLLRGVTPNDWDLATDAHPDQIESIFPHTFPSGKRFGTITVCCNGQFAEITTMRQDVCYSDGRRPDAVHFTDNILVDLSRRDFTINAIAYDFQNRFLVDPHHGRDHIYRGLLQTVGDPRIRFREDGLRMFRFFRFLATLNLHPDQKSFNAISPDFAGSTSTERIRDELSKLLVGPNLRPALIGLEKTGLLTLVIPELNVSSFSRGSYYPNLWKHLLDTTDAIQPNLTLRWAALLHDIAKPLTVQEDQTGIHFYYHDRMGAEISREILTRLHYPKNMINAVSTLIEWHMFNLPGHAGDPAVRRFITKIGLSKINDLLELRRADIVGTGRIIRETWESWEIFSQRIRLIAADMENDGSKNLAVKGQDLMDEFNLTPGPLIGKLLSFLRDLVIEHPQQNQRELLLKHAADYLSKI